ncbi:Possible hemagglutinin (DUF638) [Serratia quinivorans]|uniref:VENN motif pre-toxin domain-containing protein n=1 Tax=Serratia quinivorans TaxID=137545 RepID=UPI002178A297|nr:VENN motif pre-toxin domain-containing protein [Serratia quinivorans]CAI1845705.1 Possible hemagglutinin (DUF638) [Serratia quinivorans]CAI1913321.1 Possible hemagglutinin (DUF638) [Serratia quinivorans]CAI2114139.1 Possible hemagglutinin (DUF638) [Serratia quinivorans]CAI2132693.1 Possible hemagglutinin (DUF638) [Serratia quinivorans]CAI2396780.1 Possible hemagglutinin (DUF638) [Serratia quinivorans]
MDIIRTQGDINGLKAAKAANPTEKDVKVLRNSDAYKKTMESYGTGSDMQRAAQAVTGALQALAGNNLAGALASGAAPYLAREIKARIGDDNVAANAMAHAVLGAITAQLNNQSAVAGAVGAGGGELVARVILSEMFQGRKISDLTESEKQQVSALSQLAAGLAGGLAADSGAGVVTGSQAAKNAVENNLLGGSEDTQTKFVQEHGKNIASCADNPGSASCQKGLAMNDALMVALPAGLGGGVLAAATPELAAAAKAAIQGCAGNVVLCLNNAGIQMSEAIVPGGVGAGGAVGIGKTAAEAAAAKTANNAAHSAASGLNLNKSLASEAQLADLVKSGGASLAGNGAKDPLRDAPRLVAEYGGKVSDWSKVSSKSYTAADGSQFEIHAYRNAITGQLVEPKTIPTQK